MKLAVTSALFAALITGCATKNDSGVVLYKKPDLSKVAPGTPVSKVAGLKKPTKREVITKGELKGAEAWLYEWDAPNDEVNNRMFTSVVVKDGIITGFYEETPDKWRKDPQLYKAAKLQSAFEDLSSSIARAAQYQAAADFMAGYGASMINRAATAPVQATQNFFTYKPWENASSTANYGMIGGGPIPFGGGNQSANMTPANVYATRPNSGGLRDYSKFQPIGVVDEGKVYATRPNSGGLRDYSKFQPVGVVEDGKVYPVRPNSGGLRDYSKMQPIGVVGDQ